MVQKIKREYDILLEQKVKEQQEERNQLAYYQELDRKRREEIESIGVQTSPETMNYNVIVNFADGLIAHDSAGNEAEMKEMVVENEETILRKEFPCESCHKKLATKKSLKIHRNPVHLKVTRFTCVNCAMKFQMIT